MATINTINTATDTPASAATITNDNFTSLETDVDLNTAKVSADGSIDTHSDVDTSTTAPVNNETLSWSSSSEKWIPRTSPVESRHIFLSTPTYTTGSQSISALASVPVTELTSGELATFSVQIPSDMSAISSVNFIVFPDTTETIQADFLSDRVSLGGSSSSAAASNQTLAVTVNDLTEWNVPSSLYTVITAGDVVAFRITSDTSTIRVVGLEINYTVA